MNNAGALYEGRSSRLKKRGFFRLFMDGELIDLNERDFKTKSKKNVHVLNRPPYCTQK